MSDLEKELIKEIKSGKDVSLERALLIVSRLQREDEIEEYISKIDQIHAGFRKSLESKSPLSLESTLKYMTSSVAEWLFEYLWNTKPKRCNGNFLLIDVIDAQLNPDINLEVGSCVGLTSLYTALGLRESLDLTILVSDSHILNRLKIDSTNFCNIDNTDPLGFDCHIKEEEFFEYPPVKLIANVLNSRGMAMERTENLVEAKEDFEKAIQINPTYANAYNNRGNIKSKQGNHAGAIEDYDRAIGLNSLFVEAHCNRGIAKENLGDFSGALADFDRTVELNSEYVDAYFRRGRLREHLGDYAGALSDFDKVVELEPQNKDKVAPFRNRIKALHDTG